jgi:hypothetical protein
MIDLFDHVLELIFEVRKLFPFVIFEPMSYGFTVKLMCGGEERCLQGFAGET